MSLPMGYRVVVIPSPYKDWSSEQMKKVFCETLAMRIAGYQGEYGPKALAVDGADFIGTHYLICREESGGGLTPLMGFRSTTLADYEYYGLSFGCLSLVRAAGAQPHIEAVEKIINSCRLNSKPIAYVSSFTSRPELRRDPASQHLAKDAFKALIVHAHEPSGTRILSGCSVKYKVDQLAAFLGSTPVHTEKGDLPLVSTPFIVNEPVRLMYLKECSKEAVQEAETWRFAWERRITLPHASEQGLGLSYKKTA